MDYVYTPVGLLGDCAGMGAMRVLVCASLLSASEIPICVKAYCAFLTGYQLHVDVPPAFSRFFQFVYSWLRASE
jgi:hypothetical protein